MRKLLQITPGQPATYNFTTTGWGAILSTYTVWAALVNLGGYELATIHEGAGVLKTTGPSDQRGILLAFTGTQTSKVTTGTVLAVSLQKTGQRPIQFSLDLRIVKNLIPTAHP